MRIEKIEKEEEEEARRLRQWRSTRALSLEEGEGYGDESELCFDSRARQREVGPTEMVSPLTDRWGR